MKSNDTEDVMKDSIPIHEKFCLTINEASAYFGIGQKKLRELSSGDGCAFTLWVGNKSLLKRKALEDHINKQFSI